MPSQPNAIPHSHGPRGWHSRGYLPHFDGGEEYTQSVTFRLADSVPNHVIRGWQDELRNCPESLRKVELCRKIEDYLDTGRGACYLKDAGVGSMVEGAILYFDAIRYRVHAWVVMPNHVHVLFTPLPGHCLSDIMGSWKSYTAKEANRILCRSGQFWEEDYFDRYIRNDRHFYDAVEYFDNNPVSAGLCSRPEEWLFGSARFSLERGRPGRAD